MSMEYGVDNSSVLMAWYEEGAKRWKLQKLDS